MRDDTAIGEFPLAPSLLHHIIMHVKEACIIASSPDLTVLEVNHQVCKMLGRTRDELISAPLLSIECALQDIFLWDELNANPTMAGQRIIESEWLTSTGVAIPIEKRVIGYTENGVSRWIIYAEDITHRNRIAQEQLYLSSQLQSSLEATAEGILSVDLQGNVINVNQRFSRMLGLTDELIVSRNQKTVMGHMLSLLIDSTVFSSVLKKIELDVEIETENSLGLQDGRHWVCISKPEYLRDRVVGRVFSVRDISAMKKVEQDLVNALELAEQAVQEKSHMLDALKMSESRLRRLINSSLIGICQGDMNGHLTLANDALISLLGVSQRDIKGNRVEWLAFTAPEHKEMQQQALEQLKNTGQTAPFSIELIHTNGSKVPVMVGLAQLEGSQFEWVGFVLDLTEQKKADRVKSEFISVVSHELRTPITSVRGAMSLLENGAAGELNPKALQLVQIAHRNSQRLGLLVNDILDMEKLISGKMQFKSESFDLCLLAQQALEANAAYAAALGVSYQLILNTSIKQVTGDPERTMQVFANLLSNAAKFSPQGEIVEVTIFATAHLLRVEVKDKGPGIPLEFRERIFTKFAQADGSNTRQQGGTGLGLSIAKTIIEKMEGEIGFESELGQGSVFWFALPRSH